MSVIGDKGNVMVLLQVPEMALPGPSNNDLEAELRSILMVMESARATRNPDAHERILNTGIHSIRLLLTQVEEGQHRRSLMGAATLPDIKALIDNAEGRLERRISDLGRRLCLPAVKQPKGVGEVNSGPVDRGGGEQPETSASATGTCGQGAAPSTTTSEDSADDAERSVEERSLTSPSNDEQQSVSPVGKVHPNKRPAEVGTESEDESQSDPPSKKGTPSVVLKPLTYDAGKRPDGKHRPCSPVKPITLKRRTHETDPKEPNNKDAESDDEERPVPRARKPVTESGKADPTCPVCGKSKKIKMVGWRCSACRSFWRRLKEGTMSLPECHHGRTDGECRGCRRRAYETELLKREGDRCPIEPLTREGKRREELWKAVHSRPNPNPDKKSDPKTKTKRSA